jgi:hypothetical protein
MCSKIKIASFANLEHDYVYFGDCAFLLHAIRCEDNFSILCLSLSLFFYYLFFFSTAQEKQQIVAALQAAYKDDKKGTDVHPSRVF